MKSRPHKFRASSRSDNALNRVARPCVAPFEIASTAVATPVTPAVRRETNPQAVSLMHGLPDGGALPHVRTPFPNTVREIWARWRCDPASPFIHALNGFQSKWAIPLSVVRKKLGISRTSLFKGQPIRPA